MKDRPILPLVLSMSLPMVLSMTVASLYNIVDSYYVARISEDAMTALSLVYPIQNLINAVTIGFSIGANAVISYHLGAQNQEKANAAAAQSLLWNGLHGLVLTLVCIAVMPMFLSLFTQSAAVMDLGVRYSRVAFAFSVFVGVSMSMEKIFQAAGRMVMTMVCMLAGCVCNIVLDPVLIFGYGPFPEMGIEGAALATGIGQVLSLALYFVCNAIRPLPLRLLPSRTMWDGAIARKMYAIGIPATLNLALPSLLISCLNVILAAFSQVYVLVLGVYYKLQTFLYLPANGIVQGMRPLIGYNYGAGEHKRVRQLYQITLILSAAIMAAGTLGCLAASEPLMRLFTSTPETVEAGKIALRIICLGFVISAISTTSSGALEGLGKGTQSLVISLCRYIVFIMPLAWVLCRQFGPVGVWNAFWATEVLSAIVSLIVYKKSV